MGAVLIQDTVVLHTRDFSPWMHKMRTDYLPAAEKRGAELVNIWHTNGVKAPDTLIITIMWRVPGMAEFWALRGSAASDTKVSLFWKWTDMWAIRRSRSVQTEDVTLSVPGVVSAHRWVVVLSWTADAQAKRIGRFLSEVNNLASKSPEVLGSVAAEHLPGSVGAGDATWDLTTTVRPRTMPLFHELLSKYNDVVRDAQVVALAPFAWSVRQAREGQMIKRTLLVAVKEGVPDRLVREFEDQVARMPDYIPSIRSWALSRVPQDRCAAPWTHVWEQEFDSPDGLLKDYMESPYHVSVVDRWFDPENPMSIVDPGFSHLFHSVPRSVLHAPHEGDVKIDY